MSLSPSKLKTWFWLFLLAAVALFLWSCIQRVSAVAAVQDSLNRAWEIHFNAGGCPAILPEYLDGKVQDFLDDKFESTAGYDDGGSLPAHTRNHAEIHIERFRAFFRGSISDISIYDPQAFRGDLGTALARFPELRRVSVDGCIGPYPTEADWTLLCTRLRSFPQLKEIELGGTWVTDAAIAPLAGHPQLRTISINSGRLTADCTKTFRAIPRLTKLHIEVQIHNDGEAWLSPEDQKAMSSALPAVSIELP